jgi:RNA polymerase sigma factor (sigma-70 family)
MDDVDAMAVAPGEGTEADAPAVGAMEPSVEALFTEHYVVLVRLARLLCGSNEVAEDLVQDCFARLVRRSAPIDNPARYLRVSVINAVRSWQRRRILERRHQQVVADSHVEGGVDGLRDALAHLPLKQRSAVVLRFYFDLSESDIALTLGCRPGTVKSLISRGVDRLRDEVGHDD